MLIGVAGLLVVIWVVAFLFLHVTGFFIHILLILAVISLVGHLFAGRNTTS